LLQALGMKTNLSEAAPTSTLRAGETRQISPINEQNGAVPSLISYPARPLQGGKLDRAPKKTGLWYAQPKYNGWRALVHCPTGTMWNRHGGRLSIAHEFGSALRELQKLAEAGLIWADCEAMERRHNVGRRSLIVLDSIPDAGSPIYEERREFLESLVPLERMSLGDGTMPEDSVLLTPSIADTNGQALQLYRSLEAINRSVLADVFEGVVMKRAVSAYPVQLRSPDEKCRFWQKHRFLM
jgi:ATP-dependent DNA ligase